MVRRPLDGREQRKGGRRDRSSLELLKVLLLAQSVQIGLCSEHRVVQQRNPVAAPDDVVDNGSEMIRISFHGY